jgi:uncharacterized protein YjaG (DUF416 family)
MARLRQTVHTASLAKQMAALTRRVKALEQWVAAEEAYLEEDAALAEERQARNKEIAAEWNRQWEALKAKWEAREARLKVINEFYREYLGSRVRAVYPEIDDATRERRCQLNEFLAARGMEPEPEPSGE